MKPTNMKRYLVLLTGLLMLVSIVNVADKELLAPVVDAVEVDLGMTHRQRDGHLERADLDDAGAGGGR